MNLPKSLGLVGVALATLGTASAAQAALVVVPPSLAPGAQYRLVFVTNTTTQATSTDINDYNTNPSSAGVPIYLINGNLVANNNADLWDGSILTGIDRTPQESVGFFFVWSGTSDDGTVNAWGGALGSNVAIVGIAGAFLGSAWINESGKSGSEVYQFYGISTVLTVPTPAVTVPEPSSLLGFITLGGFMLGGAVRKARK
jgi:hypothetical protein